MLGKHSMLIAPISGDKFRKECRKKKKTLRTISMKTSLPYIHENITPLKLNHPEGHSSYHKEEKTTEKFYWVSLSFNREKILLFFSDEKD